jgi:hypothetical protein
MAVIVLDREEHRKALKCARESYQRGIILGVFNPMGSDINYYPATSKWSGKYNKSRMILYQRLHNKNIKYCYIPTKGGPPILAFGVSEPNGIFNYSRAFKMVADHNITLEEALKITFIESVL